MKSALIIFNGIKFPYHLMEFALVEAKQMGLSVHALFLKANRELTEGYGYPSDLKATEALTAAADGEKDDQDIINDHMKLVSKMAASEEVICTTQLLTDCSLEELLKGINNYEIVYVDGVYDDQNTSMLCNTKFTLKDLIEHVPHKVKQVFEDTRL